MNQSLIQPCCMMNISWDSLNLSTFSNGTEEPVYGPVSWGTAMITLVTIPLSLATITGNVLVMISFRVNPLLRTVSNYFLLSLALADLILGSISMNLYTTYILMGRWSLGNLACDVWLAVDYVASNASVMNLLAISVDRYLSVMRPLTYRATRTPKKAGLLITFAWSISFVIWAPAILLWQYIVGERTVPEGECSIQFLSQPIITFGTAIAAFYLPVTVMVTLYWRVYRVTEKRSQQLAGMMAAQGGCAVITSQRSRHSSSDSAEDLRPEQRNGQKRMCPNISIPKALWWKRQRGDNQCSTSNSLHQGDDDHEPSSADLKYVPLVRICKNSDNHNKDQSVSVSNQSGNRPLDAHRGSTVPLNSAQHSQKARTPSLIKENKAARTLSAILLAFIVTWTPYNIMVLVSTFCEECVPDGLWQLGYWLCYVNSTVNPLCYALCNKHFRVTFKALLLCRWKEEKKGIRWTPNGNG